MKKIGLCAITLVIAILAAIFLPWDKIGTLRDKILGGKRNVASLKVYSLGGDMKVFLDDQEKGTVRMDDPYLEIFPVEVGDHRVRIAREASTEGFYEDFEKVIKFEKGFDTVISWEIGPTKSSSSGWILYAQKTTGGGNTATLNVSCDPQESIAVDAFDSMENTPITNKEISLDNQYSFTLKKEGYQDLSIQILPEDEEARQRLQGYILYIEAKLYEIPIK